MADGNFVMGFFMLLFRQDSKEKTGKYWVERGGSRIGKKKKKTRDGIQTQVTVSKVVLYVGTLTTGLSAPMQMEIFVLKYDMYKLCICLVDLS